MKQPLAQLQLFWMLPRAINRKSSQKPRKNRMTVKQKCQMIPHNLRTRPLVSTACRTRRKALRQYPELSSHNRSQMSRKSTSPSAS